MWVVLGLPLVALVSEVIEESAIVALDRSLVSWLASRRGSSPVVASRRGSGPVVASRRGTSV